MSLILAFGSVRILNSFSDASSLLLFSNNIGNSKSFTGACNSNECLIWHTRFNAFDLLINSFRLITCRFKIGYKLKRHCLVFVVT